VPAPHLPGEHLVDLVFRVVLAREDLLAHDRLLLVHIRGGEARPAHDVAQHVDDLDQVLGERAA